MSAQEVYNNTPSFIIEGCKQKKENLDSFLQLHTFDSRQTEIFKELIASDGKYLWNNNMIQNKKQLIQKRVKQQKIRQKKIEQTKSKEQPQIQQTYSSQVSLKKYHHKLRQLSCLQNPTNGVVSKRHQELANMLNANIDLDKISNEDFNLITTKLIKIEADINDINDRMQLQHMQNVATYNVKKQIESKIGTSEITHKIDEICHFFVQFDKEYKNCINKIKNLQQFINDAIVKLGLGCVHIDDNGKKTLKPILACSKYSYQSGNIKAVIKGENMYNFFKNKKKQLNKLKKKLDEHSEKIKKDRTNKLFVKRMSRKKKIKCMTERDRSLRHSNRSAKKYQNKIEKSRKKSVPKDKQNKLKTNNKKIVEKNQPTINSFFNKNANKN
eukprot:470105_1